MDESKLAILRAMGGPMSADDLPKLARLFIYGDPGVGKTDLAARIIQAYNGKPIWLHTDSGVSTVTKFPDLAKETWFAPFDGFGQVRLIAEAHDEGIEPFCNYDTLVLDTVSTAENNVLRDLVKEKPMPSEQKDPNIEAWGHYRLLENSLKDTIKVLNRTDMHIIYLAHIRDPTEQDKKKKRFAIRPAGPEAAYRVIAQEANAIGWLYKDGGERLIQFSSTLQETAKTQIPTVDEKTYPVNQVPELISKYINS